MSKKRVFKGYTVKDIFDSCWCVVPNSDKRDIPGQKYLNICAVVNKTKKEANVRYCDDVVQVKVTVEEIKGR